MSRFPWTCNGVTFKTRGELERGIEQLASGPTIAHTRAATNLLYLAHKGLALTSDQMTEIKTTLHL